MEADYVVSALQGILNHVGNTSNVRVLYATSDLTQAASVAKQSDVSVVVVVAYSTEGADRATLSLGPQEEQLISVVAQNSNKVTVAINGPGAITTPWKSSVSSIIAMGYPGQEFGNALADVLFGVENPSGRLTVTWPSSGTWTMLGYERLLFLPDSQSLPLTLQWPGINGMGVFLMQRRSSSHAPPLQTLQTIRRSC